MILALAIALPALAQPPVRRAQVYRCGPDGRDLRDSPCPSGAASGASADPADAAGRAAADSRMAEAKQAAVRRAREAEARRQHSQDYGLQALPAAASAPEPMRAPMPRKPAPPASGAGR